MFILKMFMYCLFGAMLAAAGISVVNAPVSFVCLLLIVMVIDGLSNFSALDRT